jgi:2'-5' RNA ligase
MPGIRSFVAIELPDEARKALGSLQRDLRGRVPPDAVRWTRPESIHLTLNFLGDVAPGSIEQIVAALQEVSAAHSTFAFEIAGVGVFPDPKRPRVVWAGVSESSGVLVALQNDAARLLAPLGFEPEKRPFKPHLTLGRAGRHASPHELAELGEVIAQTKVGTLARVSVDHISLMKSDLRPSGAVYSQQAVISLTGEE